MNTKVDAVQFAKKLRERMRALQKERPAALKKYDRDVSKWRSDLKSWLAKHGGDRVDGISKSEIKDAVCRRYGRNNVKDLFDFAGAPEMPIFPSDKQIRNIRATLHHIGITGQKTIALDTNEIAKLMGDDEDDES